MAGRSEARIFASIWNDKAFKSLSPSRQRQYFFLLSQPDLSYCGVIPLRARRWARSAEGLTVDHVQDDLEGLAQPFPEGSTKPLIVVDGDTEEVFVRSLIRLDGIWKIPNLLKSAREAATLIESPRIRAALLEELLRIPVDESGSTLVRTILAEFISDLEEGLGNGPGNPPANGSANPSANPSAEGSQGEGERNGSSRRNPPSPVTPAPGAPEPLRTRTRVDATILGNSLLDEHVKQSGSKPPRDVLRRTGEAIDRLLDEGLEPDQIRAGLALMRARPRTGPGLLPDLVHEATTTAATPHLRAAPGYQPYRNPTDQSVYDEAI